MTSASQLSVLPTYEGQRHPAYPNIFYAYVLSGRSPTEALNMVRTWWPKEQKGLPTRQAVHYWIAVDHWDEVIDRDAQINQRAYRALINARLLSAGPAAATALINVAQGRFPDAKSGSVMSNAAKTILTLIAAGVLENRAGDIPEDETERKARLAAIDVAPLADIVAEHARAWEMMNPEPAEDDEEETDDDTDDD